MSMTANCLSMSKRVSEHGFALDIKGHFGDESFQAIECTGTNNQTRNNEEKI